MNTRFLIAALALAYGPLLAMLVIYGIGLALRLAGLPGLLSVLIERTSVPQAVRREEVDGIAH